MKRILQKKQLLFLIFLTVVLISVCLAGREKIEFQVSMNRAFYYSEHGDYESEVREYDKLIEQEPKMYELYINKAIALANNNNIGEAISTFKEAEVLNNSDPELYYNMAHLYEIMKNDELYQFYREKGMQLEFEQSVREN